MQVMKPRGQSQLEELSAAFKLTQPSLRVVIAAEAHLDIASTDGEAGAGIEDIERIVGVGGGATDDGDGVSVGPRGKIGRLARAIGADKESLGVGLL